MKGQKNLKRVLHIVSAMDRGGAETLIMNIYRNIDRTKVQFDFVTHSKNKGDFDDEILSLGGKIHQLPSLGETGPIRYIKELNQVMTSNQYIAIHSHTDYQSGFPALAAKLSGIEKRICHSHSTNWPKDNNFKNRMLLKAMRTLIKFSASHYCSCSPEAAEFLFGKKLVEQCKVDILNNGIDMMPFLSDNNCKENLLKELNLPINTKMIGHVGRFSPSKNHTFILKVLKNILETDPNYVAILVGDGPLKNQIVSEAEALGILKNIKFLGVRSDIPRLMKAFDVFLFPSLFEGFGIVTLEAQCAGTPCIVSDSVPKTTDMGLDLISFIGLREDINSWSTKVKMAALQKRPANESIYSRFIKNGYSIQTNIPKWLSLYINDQVGSDPNSIDQLVRS